VHIQNFCTERGLSFRISQFKYRVPPQSLVALKQNASFARHSDTLFATCLYRTAVRIFRIRIRFLLPPNIRKWEVRARIQDA
jgi:hypothetical protein